MKGYLLLVYILFLSVNVAHAELTSKKYQASQDPPEISSLKRLGKQCSEASFPSFEYESRFQRSQEEKQKKYCFKVLAAYSSLYEKYKEDSTFLNKLPDKKELFGNTYVP